MVIKFYGHGIVWDKERSRRLCAFNKAGEFATDDPRTQELLKAQGYMGDYDEPTAGYTAEAPQEAAEQPAGPDFANMTLAQLKAEADAAGVKYAANIGKATLAKRLTEALA